MSGPKEQKEQEVSRLTKEPRVPRIVPKTFAAS
jgi:hypothetical protein